MIKCEGLLLSHLWKRKLHHIWRYHDSWGIKVSWFIVPTSRAHTAVWLFLQVSYCFHVHPQRFPHRKSSKPVEFLYTILALGIHNWDTLFEWTVWFFFFFFFTNNDNIIFYSYTNLYYKRRMEPNDALQEAKKYADERSAMTHSLNFLIAGYEG